MVADFFTNVKAFQVINAQGNGSKVVRRWKPPQQLFLKLNTDGAWKADWATAGIGGVFRDATGLRIWICKEGGCGFPRGGGADGH